MRMHEKTVIQSVVPRGDFTIPRGDGHMYLWLEEMKKIRIESALPTST